MYILNFLKNKKIKDNAAIQTDIGVSLKGKTTK